MTPTETLRREHELILRVIDVAAREAIRVREHGHADAARVGKIADFLSGFADTCHMAKEEKLLLPLLTERGTVVRGCSIEQLLEEHDQARAHVRIIQAALPRAAGGDRAAALTLATHMADYAVLLREHIRKEDDLLYPSADRHLTDADQRELEAAFDRVERQEIGHDVYARYRALAEELSGGMTAEAGGG